MNNRSTKRLSSTPLMLQVACIFALATSTLVTAYSSCTSKNCKDLEALIKGNLKPNVDPCDDFYEYACGNFLEKNPVPAELATYTALTPFSIKLQEQLYHLISEPESPEDGKSVNAIKKQYQLCTNENALDAAGLSALSSVIEENGGWPMIVPGEFHPAKSVQEVQDEYNRKTGNGPFYIPLIYSRGLRSTENIITLDQPLAFPRRTVGHLSDKESAQLIKYIADVAAEFAKANKVTIPSDRLDKDAKDVFDFMVKLAKLRNPDEWRKRGVAMKVSEAQTAIANGSASSFDLLTSLKSTYAKLPGVELTNDEVISVRELGYLQAINKLLHNTDPKVALNYAHFHFVENYIPLTTKAMRKLVVEAYNGQALNRTVSCLYLPNVGRALSRLYIKKYVPASKIAVAKQVVDEIKAQVKVQIERTAFIDEETRPKALAKLNNLVTIVGYDDSLDSDEKVEEYYSRYKIGNNLVENILNYHEVEYQKQLEKLRQPIVLKDVREKSYTDPTNDLGMYAVRYNRLKLPASLLDVPLFAEDYPPMSNYAGFGQIVGALLSGLYSFFGPNFDDTGNLVDWPSSAAAAAIAERDKCFIEQYSNMTIKELTDAGLHYNTSDLSHNPILAQFHFALKTTYLAHRAKVAPLAYRTQTASLVEGLSLNATVDKQFFLNFANMFCQTANPQKLLPKLLYAVPYATTGRVKVNSAVSNLPEFSQVFGCAANKPMNPSKKCAILD